MTRGSLRVVPWTGVGEWKHVAHCVQDHDEDASILQEALTWLEAWCIRDNTPPAVETTCSLLEIKRSMREGRASSRCIRLALAAAIVRFVNEVVDPEQQGTFAMPVSHLAERLNIPRLLVDMRHGATHDELPSTELLLVGLDLALAWLNEHYWNPQLNFEYAVREATLRMVERFVEGARECDPLTRPAEALAGRCLSDVQFVDCSPEIQRPFLLTILESSHPIDKLMPLVLAVLRRDEGLSQVLLDIILRRGTLDAALQTLLSAVIRMVSSETTVIKCARQCLERYSALGRQLLEIILSNTKIACSEELGRLLDLMQRAPSKDEIVHGAPFLLEQTERLSLLLPHQDECPAEPADDWHVPSGWRPMPFGQTAAFNPIIDFKRLIV